MEEIPRRKIVLIETNYVSPIFFSLKQLKGINGLLSKRAPSVIDLQGEAWIFFLRLSA